MPFPGGGEGRGGRPRAVNLVPRLCVHTRAVGIRRLPELHRDEAVASDPVFALVEVVAVPQCHVAFGQVLLMRVRDDPQDALAAPEVLLGADRVLLVQLGHAGVAVLVGEKGTVRYGVVDVLQSVLPGYRVVAELGQADELAAQGVLPPDVVESVGEAQGAGVVKQHGSIVSRHADHVQNVVVVVAAAVVGVPGVVVP